MRYTQLIDLAHRLNPEVILEVGTHVGKRARHLAAACKMYYGFDLWDEADEEEMNGKGSPSLETALLKLQGYRFELIRGNTRKTLPEFLKRGVRVDLAFIDGGHSIETIRSDYANVRQMMKPGGVIIFDDYYKPERSYGCNAVVIDIQHKVLPESDKGVHLVRVDCP